VHQTLIVICDCCAAFTNHAVNDFHVEPKNNKDFLHFHSSTGVLMAIYIFGAISVCFRYGKSSFLGQGNEKAIGCNE
jgi:hypothetical protein